jgi:hypothetical protein
MNSSSFSSQQWTKQRGMPTPRGLSDCLRGRTSPDNVLPLAQAAGRAEKAQGQRQVEEAAGE